jgi:hypothetical protein
MRKAYVHYERNTGSVTHKETEVHNEMAVHYLHSRCPFRCTQFLHWTGSQVNDNMTATRLFRFSVNTVLRFLFYLWYWLYGVEPGWLSRYSECLRAGRQRDLSSSLGSVKNFLFSRSCRPALGPTQPPIQWVPGALSPVVKLPGA